MGKEAPSFSDEEVTRILRQAFVPELEVKVRPGADLTGISTLCNDLTIANPVTHAFHELLVVLVDRNVSVRMLDGNRKASFLSPICKNDVAVANRPNRRSFRYRKVNRVVPGPGIVTPRQKAVYRRLNRKDQAGKIPLHHGC